MTRPWDNLDRALIRRLCGDLGDGMRPFADIAAELGLSEDDVLARVKYYRETGLMRRFGAILRHQTAGFSGNGMSVWDVPEDRVDEVGRRLAACPEISHCYERPRFDDWPFNVYGMIHGRTEAECLNVAESLSRELEIGHFRVLFSVREFKKTSMVYFEQELLTEES